MIAKNIAIHELFRLNKFVTCQSQLDSFQNRGSLGYAFLERYQNRLKNTNPENLTQEDRKKLWSDAKDAVHSAINQARATKQLGLHRKWNGTYMCSDLL